VSLFHGIGKGEGHLCGLVPFRLGGLDHGRIHLREFIGLTGNGGLEILPGEKCPKARNVI
jgi:hypothetical protein